MNWDMKIIFFITLNDSTYKSQDQSPLREPDPGILFNYPPTSLIRISPNTRMAKGLGQWEYAIGKSFFTLFILFQMGPLAIDKERY